MLKRAVAGISVSLAAKAIMAALTMSASFQRAGSCCSCTAGMSSIIMVPSATPTSPPGTASFCGSRSVILTRPSPALRSVQAQVVLPRHRNPPDGDGGPNHWEVWLRDPDGYTLVLASPDGSADGNWRP